MRKCVIIINPESGKKKKLKNYNIFYDTLRKYGYETEIIFTKRKGHAIEIVQELDRHIDLVISAGGDGTLNEVVTGNMLRKHKLLLANLPLGTTNDVGNMYGYTKDIKQNLEILLNGKPKKIDVCYIDNTAFIYVACLGDYIDMAYNTPRTLKKKYGNDTSSNFVNGVLREIIKDNNLTERHARALLRLEDENAKTKKYSYFQHGIFGAPGQGKSGTVNFCAINSSQDVTLSVTVKDSRGNTTTAEKEIVVAVEPDGLRDFH